jgi:cytochrome c oxidase cbb3-type subunit 3
MKSFSLLALAGFALVACAPNRANDRRAGQRAPDPQTDSSAVEMPIGRTLFLKNCAHCHGSDARGGEGPDLHNLDWTDEQIAARIRKGKEGEMTAFAEKLSAQQIKEVIAHLRTLK